MAAAVRSVYEAVDRGLQTAPEYETATCKKGCAACCRMLVVTTYPEAVALVSRFPKEVDRARPQLEADLAALTEVAINAAVPMGVAHMLDRERHIAMADGWWALQRPCPFLSAENTCTVYEARPLACRNYLVQTEPEHCAEVPQTRVAIMQLTKEDTARALGMLADAQERAGVERDFVVGALSEMVLFARAQLRAM